MRATAIAIRNVGLVTSLGLGTAPTCAALRAGVANPTETGFVGLDGHKIMGHQVCLDEPWRGLRKLAKMQAMAIEECLDGVSEHARRGLPLLLCVAEPERPGRLEGLDEHLVEHLQAELGFEFAERYTALVPLGRPGVLVALERARELVLEYGVERLVIAATDSLLSWPMLGYYGQQDRLLAEDNSNGFIPGEGAGALLVGRPADRANELLCVGSGSGREPAAVMSEDPLRADGLTAAINNALEEAGLAMHELDWRITDLSGEQYFFKEAALALGRTLRSRKEEYDLWHPAEGIGEAGALAGAAMVAAAWSACRKGYAPGPRALLHAGDDLHRRAAAVLVYSTGA